MVSIEFHKLQQQAAARRDRIAEVLHRIGLDGERGVVRDAAWEAEAMRLLREAMGDG